MDNLEPAALDGGLIGGCFGNSSILGGHSSKADSYHFRQDANRGSGGTGASHLPAGRRKQPWGE